MSGMAFFSIVFQVRSLTISLHTLSISLRIVSEINVKFKGKYHQIKEKWEWYLVAYIDVQNWKYRKNIKINDYRNYIKHHPYLSLNW